MNITIPELSLVVLIGPSGCGKSSFAREHFKATEVLSSDFCRGLVSDDENSQEATNDAFDVLHYVARKRLAAGRLTVVDATNVQPEARKPLVALAREFHVLPVAIVLNLPEKVCHERNQSRPDRQFGPHVIRNQAQQLRRSLRGLEREGFRHVFVLSSPEEVSSVTIVRQPLWNNLKHEHGPFDIIGDVHGCFDELQELLEELGYEVNSQDGAVGSLHVQHPQGRKVIFLGDLVDRGPNSTGVLQLAMDMVVYGHTPVPEPDWLNRTINIDTGCAFGGKLTALRYPEKELVSVPAAYTYWESARPFLAKEDQASTFTAQQQQDDILVMEDVSGKRIITSRLVQNVTIR